MSSNNFMDLITNGDSTVPVSDFSHVIGQSAVIKRLNFYLKSHKPGLAFPSMLFTGSHGLGKTYVAKILANNLGRRFLEINCGTIFSTKDFIEDILLNKVMGMQPITILMDEAHRLSGEVSTILLTLLANNEKNINILEYKGWEIKYDLSKINMILATTDSFKIFQPLTNRCEAIYFKSYSNKDLIKMLQFYLPDIKFEGFSNEKLEDLAYACRGRGRDTYQLAQKIKRYCESQSKKSFNVLDWVDIKDVFGVFPLGLTEQELNLMRIVRIEKVISCANIAARMMVGEENISEEMEIRLKELNLINNSSRGRVLTSKGKDYFDNILKEKETKSKEKLGN